MSGRTPTPQANAYQAAFDAAIHDGCDAKTAEMVARFHVDKLAKQIQDKIVRGNVQDWQKHRSNQKAYHVFHRAFNTPFDSHVRA